MKRKLGTACGVTVAALSLLVLLGGLYCQKLVQGDLKRVTEASAAADRFFESAAPETWENTAALKMLNATPAAEEEPALYTYTSPEEIEFLSLSEEWDEGKLESLYEELLRNVHGEELYTLSQVWVLPNADPDAAASHQSVESVHRFQLNFPSIPTDFSVHFKNEAGVITLYDGDRLTTPEEMADSLSHEYGHHFTFYHMFDRDAELLATEYAGLRGLDRDQRVLTDTFDRIFYIKNHQWYLTEIAAEDYVTLMGSPNSRSVEDYYDIRERLNGWESQGTGSARNAVVQENLMIPMASECPGLADYFYSFVEEKAPACTEMRPFDLFISSDTVGYDLVDGYHSFTAYTLSWDKVYGEEAVYTLVSFEEEDYLNTFVAIRTVEAGESASAEIGTVSADYGDSVSWAYDNLDEGTRTFVVTVTLPDGALYCSNPLTYTF